MQVVYKAKKGENMVYCFSLFNFFFENSRHLTDAVFSRAFAFGKREGPLYEKQSELILFVFACSLPLNFDAIVSSPIKRQNEGKNSLAVASQSLFIVCTEVDDVHLIRDVSWKCITVFCVGMSEQLNPANKDDSVAL